MPYPLMLATPASTDPVTAITQLQTRADWTFELKYDGIRAVVHLRNGSVTIINRNGRDITYRYPDVVHCLSQSDANVVLDGEIVCLDRDGRPDFYSVHRRDAQGNARAAAQLARSLPAQFVPFDILEQGDVDLRMLPYTQRRDALVALTDELHNCGASLPPVSQDGALLWQVVADMGLEGLVAKRNGSRYVGRRSQDWVKIKHTRRLSALVSGYDRGEGYRSATFGALQLSLLDDQRQLVKVGTVGSGFKDRDVSQIWALLAGNRHPIIVEVAYLDVSPDGQLRQPVFKGLRTDIPATDCTMTQILGPNG